MKKYKILKIEKARDLCDEAGWYGYDILLNEAVDENFVFKLGLLGNLIYLPNLKQPFFKIENKGCLVKGVVGRNEIRIGIAYDDKVVLKQIIDEIEKIYN